MEDLVNKLIPAYQALQGTSNEEIQSASRYIMEIYQDPHALVALLTILENSDVAFFRLQAAVALPRVLSRSWESIDFQDQVIDSLVNSLYKETVFVIRDNIGYVFSDLIPEAKAPQLFDIIQTHINSTDPNVVHASLLLFRAFDIVELPPHLLELGIMLIDAGFRLQLYVPSLDLAFLLGAMYPEQLCQNMSKYWELAICYIPSIIDDLQTLQHLSQKIFLSFYNNDSFADPTPVFDHVYPLLIDETIDVDSKLLIVPLFNAIVPLYYEMLQEADMINQILSAFIQLSLALFDPNDSFYVSRFDVFGPIVSCISYHPEGTELIFQFVEQLLDNAAGRSVALLLLHYSFDNGQEELIYRVEDIVSVLIDTIVDECAMTREASATAIGSFIDTFGDDVNDIIAPLVDAVLTALTHAPSLDIITVLSKLFESTKGEADFCFESAYNLLVPMIEQASTTAQLHLIPCFSALCINSPQSVSIKFNDVFNMMIGIIFGQNLYVKHHAVSCISSLMRACPDLFKPHVVEFTQFLIQSLSSEDTQLIEECVQSIGAVTQRFPAIVEELVVQAIPTLIEMGSQDLNPIFKQEVLDFIKMQTLQENGEAEFDLDQESETLDSFSIVGGVIMLLCAILNEYPHILGQYTEPVIHCIEIQSKSSNVECLGNTCRAMCLIIQAICKTNDPFTETLSKIFDITLEIIKSTTQSYVAGEAFSVFSAFLSSRSHQYIGDRLQTLLHYLKDGFENKLLCQDDRNGYDEELHPSLSMVLRDLIVSLDVEAPVVLADFLPIATSMVSNKKKDVKNMAIQILGEFVQASSERLDENFLWNVLNYAKLSAKKDGNPYAFYCFKQFVHSSTDFINRDMDSILSIIHNKLTMKPKKTVNFQIMLENIVVALSSIVRFVVQDAFPIDQFLLPVLSIMPPKHEVIEAQDMFELYVWLYQRAYQKAPQEFAKVLILLFAKSEIDIVDMQISDELMTQLRTIFASMFNEIPTINSLIEEVLLGDQYKLHLLQQNVTV